MGDKEGKRGRAASEPITALGSHRLTQERPAKRSRRERPWYRYGKAAKAAADAVAMDPTKQAVWERVVSDYPGQRNRWRLKDWTCPLCTGKDSFRLAADSDGIAQESQARRAR